MQKIELYPYQDLKYNELRYALREGHRDLALLMPPSSGKTKTTQYLLGDLLIDEDINLAIIVVPLLGIKISWLNPIDLIRPSNRGYTVEYRAENFPVDKLTDINFWSYEHKKIFVISRAAFGTSDFCNFVEKSNLDFSKILVVPDEGHHHVETTLAGKICDNIHKKGGTILKVTGTPWHYKSDVIKQSTYCVTLSNSEYARQTDPLSGLPLAPRNWEFRKIQIPYESDKIEEVVEIFNTKQSNSSIYKDKFIESFLAKYKEDGYPKAIVNVPRISWAADLITALKSINLKVVNFTGTGLSKVKKQELFDLLTYESNIKDYNDSKIDLIVACSRLDEGVDWRLCSHVYNARIPDSPRQIIQRWARAGRCKHNIVNYPENYKDLQSITFFIPQPSESLKEEIWEKYNHIAILMACYIEDFKTAEKWIDPYSKVSDYLRIISDKKSSPQKINKAVTEAIGEINKIDIGNSFEKAQALQEIVKILFSTDNDISLVQLQELVDAKFPPESKNNHLILKAALEILSDTNSELREDLAQARRKISYNLIRDGLSEEFKKIAEKFKNLIIIKPKSILERAMLFTAFDAEEIVKAFKEYKNFQWNANLIKSEAENYKLIYGKYPTKISGSWDGFNGFSWNSANEWLRSELNITLIEFLGSRAKRKAFEALDAVLYFISENGLPTKKDSIYNDFMEIKRHYPDLLKAHLPELVISSRLTDAEKLEELRKFKISIGDKKIRPHDKPYYNYMRYFIDIGRKDKLEDIGISVDSNKGRVLSDQTKLNRLLTFVKIKKRNVTAYDQREWRYILYFIGSNQSHLLDSIGIDSNFYLKSCKLSKPHSKKMNQQ